MRYTRTVPTVEGYYFKRHTDSSAENPTFRETEKIVYIGEWEPGFGLRVQNHGPRQGYTEYGTDLRLWQNPEAISHTEWAGPIPFPEG
jgi:hypothetical protein